MEILDLEGLGLGLGELDTAQRPSHCSAHSAMNPELRWASTTVITYQADSPWPYGHPDSFLWAEKNRPHILFYHRNFSTPSLPPGCKRPHTYTGTKDVPHPTGSSAPKLKLTPTT